MMELVDRILGAFSMLVVGTTICMVQYARSERRRKNQEAYYASYWNRVTQSTAVDKMQLEGSCQCKQLSFRLRSALPFSAVQTREDPYLNRKGQVPMMLISTSDFELIEAPQDCKVYTHLETGSQHLFCPECGIHVLHLHAHHPECLAVNVFCLNPLPRTLSVGQVPASVLMGPSMPVVDATESIPIAKQVDNSETTKSLDDILLAYIQSPPSPRRKDSRDSIVTASTTMSESQASMPTSPKTREVDVLTMKYQLERYIKPYMPNASSN